MNSDLVLTARSDAIATLSLNRPAKRNAITAELVEALYQALVAINADPAIKVILLKGEGKAFCAGADLTANDLEAEPNLDAAHKEIDRLQDITRQLLNSRKIVISRFGHKVPRVFSPKRNGVYPSLAVIAPFSPPSWARPKLKN